MASQGPLSPSDANQLNNGNPQWTNITNVFAEDASVSSVSLFSQGSDQLKVLAFGFSVPSGATINGIVAEVKRSGGGILDIHDLLVQMVKGGTPSGSNKASGTIWPGSLTYASYGANNDLWGETWNDTDINSGTFGLAVAATAFFDSGNIDHIRLTVYYTAGASAPTVTDTSPASGGTAGGTAITLTGTDFTDASDVSVGGVSCSSLVVVGPTSITCITGAHAAGVLDVVVTTPAGTGTQTNGFTYLAPAPTVSNVSPALGSLSAGTPITITGTGFVATPTVTLGGVSATSVVFGSSTSLTCKTPVQSSGQKTVQVINPDAQSGSLPNAFKARASKSMRPYANT